MAISFLVRWRPPNAFTSPESIFQGVGHKPKSSGGGGWWWPMAPLSSLNHINTAFGSSQASGYNVLRIKGVKKR